MTGIGSNASAQEAYEFLSEYEESVFRVTAVIEALDRVGIRAREAPWKNKSGITLSDRTPGTINAMCLSFVFPPKQ